MSEQTYWIADTSGAKALVVGADERDRWTRVQGWVETTEPGADDMVWLQHDVHGGRQAFAAGAVEQWQALGWHPSAPPEPVDLTKDRQFTDQAPAVTPADEPTPKPARFRASSGQKEE